MMRHAIIVLIIFFGICFTQNITPVEQNNKTLLSSDFSGFTNGRKYLCYEFGLNKSIKVYIAEGDTICDVVICEPNNAYDQCKSTICRKTPILQWAFDKMPVEINRTQYIIDNNYKPYHYSLTLHNDTCQTIASSSSLEIKTNDDVKHRLDELKAFIVDLWYSNSNPEKTNYEGILYRSLPDSLFPLLENRPVIFYSYGHYGHSWSLIVKTDTNYRTFSGKVDYSGMRHFNETKRSDQFDTARLFSKNQAILSWGFDTISAEINKMKKVKREHYVTTYTDLSVFNSTGINTFSSDDAVAYSGPDSISFNKKFHKLCLIMWWLSDSKIRQYIPESAIY